jgi:hypothetical protein
MSALPVLAGALAAAQTAALTAALLALATTTARLWPGTARAGRRLAAGGNRPPDRSHQTGVAPGGPA